ncbi:MAG: NAD-dependent epimerase [Anaerolineaceae bacterium]|jgi:threonine 3-dehydrogenase|nr:NAD-dependent epimerase/dehydratase family protein [Anaerolineae bacterium]MBL1171332.1 NAD-dependent epimerase/dehydratase family protein [Chloroflexota bacterium]MBW7919717.1 NAD-dependent epimerase/dehydratase family protein [Anaerolineales bacterium]MCE7905965.1 NAD-dependent epimerase/dehydratase family protein [Anaerolineae bacterium CFX3]MDL1926466.1 NAD-dependent epimerase/dehydratase family protein [Anaerolineae bacterium AMX1]OQY81812.1 MAG: epimerase [Anaerolineae bacterium UTCFX
MTEKSVLVTGACGEIGQALVQGLAARGGYRIVTADLAPLPDSIHALSAEHVQGDLVNRVKQFYDYDFDIIYHLAASLSSKAEVATEEAHRINVEGTMQLLMLAAYKSEKYKKPVKFLFPSSIAAYGMADLEEKQKAGRVKEEDHDNPHTMYGCNKLYCEKLGMYYGHFHGQKHLDPAPPVMLDFRAIRFPGLISAFTLPSGGTSDYGPEMLHHAADGKPYACFVREDTKISFMAMPDAIKSLLMLTDAPRERLTRQVYNIAAFALTAGEFRDRAVKAFPGAEIVFEPNPRRQGIVDSWPEDLDDSRARADWGWNPDYDADKFFEEYFLPEIRKRYGR